MDRRNFLCRVTATVAGSAAVEGAALRQPKKLSGVTYHVKGFTCITCAVGLEVMLRGLKGVTQAHASYPANNVAIKFDGRAITEKTIMEFIQACGFSVA